MNETKEFYDNENGKCSVRIIEPEYQYNKSHMFNVGIAQKYGITEAIILHNLLYWLEHNKANNKNLFDNYYWTFNSIAAFHELLPYLSEKQIRYALKKLEDQEIIKTGNYNKHKYDQTKWYTIIDKTICTFCQMVNNKKDKPIPLINTDSKQNNKLSGVPDDKEQALNSFNKSSIKEKILSSKKKEINPLVKKIIDLFLEYNKKASKEKNYNIKNINFTTTYIKKYLKEYNSENEFIDSFKNSLNPYKNKTSNLPMECSHYFKSPNKNAIIESSYLYNRNKNFNPVEKKLKNKYPEYTKQLSDVLQKDINDDIVGYINALVRKNKEIKEYDVTYNDVYYYRDEIELDNTPDQDYINVIRNLDGFINEYMLWLEEQFENETFKFEYNYFNNNFKLFEKWIFDRYDSLSFFPSEETMRYKINIYLESKK